MVINSPFVHQSFRKKRNGGGLVESSVVAQNFIGLGNAYTHRAPVISERGLISRKPLEYLKWSLQSTPLIAILG